MSATDSPISPTMSVLSRTCSMVSSGIMLMRRTRRWSHRYRPDCAAQRRKRDTRRSLETTRCTRSRTTPVPMPWMMRRNGCSDSTAASTAAIVAISASSPVMPRRSISRGTAGPRGQRVGSGALSWAPRVRETTVKARRGPPPFESSRLRQPLSRRTEPPSPRQFLRSPTVLVTPMASDLRLRCPAAPLSPPSANASPSAFTASSTSLRASRAAASSTAPRAAPALPPPVAAPRAGRRGPAAGPGARLPSPGA